MLKNRVFLFGDTLKDFSEWLLSEASEIGKYFVFGPSKSLADPYEDFNKQLADLHVAHKVYQKYLSVMELREIMKKEDSPQVETL